LFSRHGKIVGSTGESLRVACPRPRGHVESRRNMATAADRRSHATPHWLKARLSEPMAPHYNAARTTRPLMETM
jgi:hypothetical protein